MMDQNNKHLLILVGIGVAAIVLAIALFSQKPTPQPGPTPPSGGGTPANNLPKDLRVVSGGITDISASSMTIEWSVPQKFNSSEVKMFPKHITWTRGTVFDAVAPGPAATPKTLAASDLKVGQLVTVTAAETAQDHFELRALHVRVELPPTR